MKEKVEVTPIKEKERKARKKERERVPWEK